LDNATELKTVAGNMKLPQDSKGLIAQFYAFLEREGYPPTTKYPEMIKQLVKLGADLQNPENVKAIIGRLKGKKRKGEEEQGPAKNGTKTQFVYAYDAFAKMLKISWVPPKYRQEEIIPFVPDESELDCLISACRS